MDLCVSDGASVRSLSRIANTASKLSEFVQFTPTASSLNLRVLSASQTTFAVFCLQQPFFSEHNFPLSCASYKVPTRALLPPLRSPATVSSLRIRSADDSLHLLVHARSGVCKLFRLPLVDGRVSAVSALHPQYSLRSSPRLFLDILLNFHLKLDEITLIPNADAIKLTSFVEDDPSHVILRTEMTVSSSELEQYNSPSDQPPLTIPCRPLRTALDFCDPFDSPITIAFTQPGDPLLLTFDARNIDNLILFDTRFVFATRQEQSANPLQSRQTPTQLPAAHQPAPPALRPSHSDQITTPIRQPITAQSLQARSSLARRTPAHQSPSSEYVTASLPQSNHYSSMPSDHAPVLLQTDPFANYPALSGSQAQAQDDDDEYVDATPPP